MCLRCCPTFNYTRRRNLSWLIPLTIVLFVAALTTLSVGVIVGEWLLWCTLPILMAAAYVAFLLSPIMYTPLTAAEAEELEIETNAVAEAEHETGHLLCLFSVQKIQYC